MQYSSLKTITLRQIPFQELYLQLRENFNSNDVPTIVYRFLQKIRENSNCWLSLEDFIFCTRGDQNGYYPKVEIDRNLIDDPNSNLYQTRNELEKYLKQNKRIYGVTTGFGSARRYPLPSDQSGWLSANILYSHATGVGKPLPVEIVRGIMLLRLKTFSQGFSAVSIQVLQKLEEMLNSGIIPYVPEKGSVGSSGDLAPLAHLFLVLIGKGKAWIVRRPTDLSSCNAFPSTNAKYALVDNNDDCRILHLNPKTFGLQQNQLEEYLSDHPLALLRGEEAWKAVGLEPLREQDLTMKDGLAMTNGATVAASLLAHAVYDALLLYDAANQAGALTLSAVSGHTRAFEPIAQVVRPHIGQMVTSFQMLNLLQGNELVNRIGYEEDAQDDYSIRAIPQVHGAVWDTIQSVKEKVEIEMNSATDNPLFFSSILRNGMKDFVFQDTRFEHEFSSTLGTTHCSAANFHGEPIAIAADCLKIAISELASISERRIQLLLDSNHNRGLPANLTLLGNGLHSGFMIFQYTAASLVSDNKILCHPASVDSIPTSSNAEDHVSMATNAARHCCSVIQNTSNVIAIELICALQACDLRTKMLGVWLTQKYNEEQKNCGLKEFFQNLFGVQFEHRAKVYLDDIEKVFSIDENGPIYEFFHSIKPFQLGKHLETLWVQFRMNPTHPIPFILHDGVGSNNLKVSVNWVKTFKEIEPSELIRTVSGMILSGVLNSLQ